MTRNKFGFAKVVWADNITNGATIPRQEYLGGAAAAIGHEKIRAEHA